MNKKQALFPPPRLVLLLTLALSFPAAAVDDALTRGKSLLDEGKSKAAWELLQPLEEERAGEPAYDFLLGLAALEMGQNTRAVFALERVLVREPDNARARAELARAYLALGENRAARQEFEKVRQQDIPKGVASTIDTLLAMIERAESRNRPSLKGHVELSAGRDSNVNSATESTTIVVPALGVATLGANSVKNADSFMSIAGGIAYRHPFAGGHAFTAGLNVMDRQNRHDTQFDTRSIDGSAGWQVTRGKDSFNVALALSKFQRDGDDLRDTKGINAQWQHDYSAVRQATLYAQLMAITYPDQAIRDANRLVLGAGYAQAFGSRTVAFGSAYLGGEKEKAGNQEQLGHTLGGLRAGTQVRYNDRLSVLGNAAFEMRRYGGTEPLFNEQRTDRQAEAGISVDYRIDKRWKVGGRIAYVKNDSSIPVYDYDRSVYSANVRFDF
jgi:outer membrane protein